MPLQFKNIAVGNLQDDVSGNNYAANKAVYILNLNNTLAQIFSDEAGTIPIVQDGVNNVTGAKGVFGFWVEAGDYFVQVGANKYRVSITGADYFNNRVDETVDLIVDAVAGRGAYYVVGSFEAGFTYTDINQVGTFGGTDYYVFTGGLTNLTHPVPAGTDPTLSSDYAQVFYGEIDNVQGLREELNDRALRLTLTEAQAKTDLVAGQYVTLTDYRNGTYKVVADTETGGLYKTGLVGAFKLELIPVLDLYMVEHYVDDITGVTDVSTSVAEVISFAKATGFGLVSAPTTKFNMGGFPDASDLSKLLINVDGFHYETNNCEFILIANLNPYHDGRASQVLFEVEANDVYIGSVKVTADTIARDGSDRQGVHAFWFNNSTRNTKNNKLASVTGSKLISCATVTSSDPVNFRLRGLEHGDLFNDGGYYVLNCAENGDGFNGILSSNDCIRTYFCYGVKGHKYKINTYNHLKFSDVVVARFSRDTEDINIDYTCHSSATSSGVISFEHINDDSGSTISNVTLNFDIKVSNPANPSINFKSFTAAGGVEATTSKNFSEIRLKGKTNSTTPLALLTEIVGETKNSIYIEKDELIRQQDTKGYNFIVGKNRIAFSDAAGGMACKFNVSDLIFTPSWGKLTVFGTNNRVAFDDTYIIRDYYVVFAVASDGAVNIVNTPQISEVLQDALALSPTITFTAQSAGSYQLQVSLNNYTGVNRIVRCSLELFSGQSPF